MSKIKLIAALALAALVGAGALTAGSSDANARTTQCWRGVGGAYYCY